MGYASGCSSPHGPFDRSVIKCPLETVGYFKVDIMAAIKIKSEHKESQGDFVLLNEEDFDPNKHELYDETSLDANKEKKSKKEPKSKLDPNIATDQNPEKGDDDDSGTNQNNENEK